jgi:hypothetical protein
MASLSKQPERDDPIYAIKAIHTMLPRFSIFGWIIFALLLVSGCSTPESQERLDTALCWLRPSCLPSQLPQSKPPATPAAVKNSPPAPPPKRVEKMTPHTSPSPKCVASAQATVQASKPSVTVSYVEPTTNANGQPLTNLAKTTIYHDVGEGLVKYKDIPATSHLGGGKIQEIITFAVPKGTSIQAIICVTATDTNGLEG